MELSPLQPTIKNGRRVERVKRVHRVDKIKAPNYYESRNYNPKRDEIVGETSQKRASRYTSHQSIYEIQSQMARNSVAYRKLNEPTLSELAETLEQQFKEAEESIMGQHKTLTKKQEMEEFKQGMHFDVSIKQDGTIVDNRKKQNENNKEQEEKDR